MKAINGLSKYTKYYQKTVRPLDFTTSHPSNILSSSYIAKHENKFEEIEDIGYMNRINTEPKSLNSLDHPSNFHQVSGFGKDLSATGTLSTTDHTSKRTCFIFQKGTNHMQCTPSLNLGDSWVLDLVSIMDTRHGSMFWNRFSCDGYSRWGSRGEMSFNTAEDAIKFAKSMGWEYEVNFSGKRYHQLKSYAENFTFKKEQLSDSEEGDIDFQRI